MPSDEKSDKILKVLLASSNLGFFLAAQNPMMTLRCKNFIFRPTHVLHVHSAVWKDRQDVRSPGWKDRPDVRSAG